MSLSDVVELIYSSSYQYRSFNSVDIVQRQQIISTYTLFDRLIRPEWRKTYDQLHIYNCFEPALAERYVNVIMQL